MSDREPSYRNRASAQGVDLKEVVEDISEAISEAFVAMNTFTIPAPTVEISDRLWTALRR